MSDDRRRILLIDDSELILAAEEQVLSEAGFQVRAVSSLRQLVNTIMDWQPHLIVTDLYMPDMKGDELCKWLRRQNATHRTPIIICSSASDEELADVTRAVGADGYVSKNDDLDALPQRLRQLCDEIVW
ncbi:MAG: response regulator [Polyangiales bacterium]